MSKFQIAVLALLGLITCIVLVGVGVVLYTFSASQRVAQAPPTTLPPTPEPTATSTITPTPLELPTSPARTEPTQEPTNDPNRHYEEEGGFSYVPPQKWTISEYPGSEYKVVIATPSDGFAPNINIVDESFAGSLESYVEVNIEAMRFAFQDFQIIAQEDFQPDEGNLAVRLITENVQEDRELRQIFYVFDGGTQMFVVTCSRLANKQNEVDTACEESMKTFRFE